MRTCRTSWACALLALAATGALGRAHPTKQLASSGQPYRTAGLAAFARAMNVLDEGVRAMGGMEALRAAKTVRRQLSGDWYGSGQGKRPESFSGPTLAPPASNGRSQLTTFTDYGRGRWLDEVVESDFTGDFITRVDAAEERIGFETITYRAEKPFFRSLSAQDLPALRARRMRRYPEGALLMAWDRPESLQWVGEGVEFGRRQRVISFADAVGTRVLLYFDASTHRLAKMESLRSHSVAGDACAETLFDDYRAVGGLRLPFHQVDRVAGVPTEELRATSIDLNAAPQEERFRPPVDYARMVDDPPEPAVQKLGDGLYLVRAAYNSMFAVLGDSVVVFEAPLNSGNAEILLKLVHETVPGRPVRCLVSSHFHFDHLAGIRPFVAEDIPIVTTADARAVIERIASARHTLHPDALSRNPKAPRFEIVSGKRAFDDATNPVELHDFGPTDHVDHILVAHFPKSRLLFVADLWDVVSIEQPIAGSDAERMAKRIDELGLQVEQIIPVHGAPATMQMLKRGLAVRAKYFK